MIYDLLSLEERKLTRHIKLKKDEILFHEGEICSSVGIVIKGLINISSYSYQGIEMNYATISKDEIFGNNLLFSSEPIYKGHVIAKMNTEIILIDKNNLIQILQNNKEFLSLYLTKQSNLSIKMNNKIKTLSFYHAEDRFIYYLASHNNVLNYHSITSLALELNLSREVLSRLITRLIKENKIIKNKHTIYLNNAK